MIYVFLHILYCSSVGFIIRAPLHRCLSSVKWIDSVGVAGGVIKRRGGWMQDEDDGHVVALLLMQLQLVCCFNCVII